MRSFLILVVIAISHACNPDPIDFDYPAIEFPENIQLGESEVYLNGEKVDYIPILFFDSINNQLQAGFRFMPDFSVTNTLAFDFLPLKTGEYILHEDRILYKGAKTSLSQIVNSEFDGWEFELVQAEKGTFNINALDTINQTIEGYFKAYFEVIDKNGFSDTKLPEKIKFEGMFNENYFRG
ncbi:MAG: hypothetical protein R2879_00200 [Saprospiraceae bacterium]